MLLRLSLLLTAPRLHRLPRASRNQPVARRNLRLHRAGGSPRPGRSGELNSAGDLAPHIPRWELGRPLPGCPRSEEHTSELQSRLHLVCRLLLEKKKKKKQKEPIARIN